MTYRSLIIILIVIVPFFIWSGIGARRLDLWVAEILPLVIGYTVLIRSVRSFSLTWLNYFFIFSGSILMLVGSYYSYSHVPLFEYFKDVFDFQRNHFDKLVHFYQGLTVTLISREIIIRRSSLNSLSWANIFAMITAAAFAAIWEIIEWLFVLLIVSQGVPEPVNGFLGEQNDAWDAQSDMFFAIIGAGFAILVFRRFHDRLIRELPSVPCEYESD
jgi:putative membrane protein